MAKKAKPKITQVRHIAEEGTKMEVPVVDGLCFRWCTPSTRNSMGWGIWSPVLRDSELGAKVSEQKFSSLNIFQSAAENSNYFMQGLDCALSFCSQEAMDAHKKTLSEKAGNRIDQVDAERLQKNVLIPTESGYKK